MNRNEDFKDVQHGQPVELSARRHNAVNEVLRRNASTQFDRGVVAQPARTARMPDIAVRNVSGRSLDRFSVVEITGSAIAAGTQGFQAAPVLEVDTPGEDAIAIAVLAAPIGDGRTAGAWLHGFVTLQIDVIEADHKYVDAKNGSTQFESGEEGYAIQWKESGTGVKWAVVNLSRQSGGGGEPGSSIVLAQAQPGGIPKRTGIVMGFGRARLLEQIDNGIENINPLELTREITVVNPSLKVAGAEGDRLIWLSDDSDDAMIIGWDRPNDGDPTVFQQRQPEEG